MIAFLKFLFPKFLYPKQHQPPLTIFVSPLFDFLTLLYYLYKIYFEILSHLLHSSLFVVVILQNFCNLFNES
uniref:Uncharacterized protein n=1 Tax=Meloidogyne enterolobii TaxID=390850 RepID=A0A6V7V2N2_MELEN|nr:unnamed protein product [Meloidogyne enterolobii]